MLRKLRSLIKRRIFHAKHKCSVCGSWITVFDPLPKIYHDNFERYQFIFPIHQFETFNFLDYQCPACKATDRERLYALYLKTYWKPASPDSCAFLDFAPSRALQSMIKTTYPGLAYRSADLLNPDVDDQVDITDMRIYRNESFDFLICSHVLEHVRNDELAIRELYRVLRVGAKGIVMVPIMLCLNEDYEDTKIVLEQDRWKHFAQNDHVRMYSKKGFTDKLITAGFRVYELGVDLFGAKSFDLHAIGQRSVLYLVERPS